MIVGLDREIKPIWVHETLKMAEPGMNVSDLRREMMEKIVEVGGKEARRKVLTVIMRYFVERENKGVAKYIIKDSPLLHLAKQREIEEMINIYIYNLLLKSESVRYTTEMLLKRYKNTTFRRSDLSEIVYNKFGIRNVSKKFIRAYLNTSISFGIINKWDEKTYSFKIPVPLDEFQIIVIFALFMDNAHINPIPIREISFPKYMELFDMRDPENVIKRFGDKYGMHLSYRKNGAIVYFEKSEFLNML